MGAGAFIMAEVTGIPYVEIVVAAVIPALLYFLAVFFMVDNEAIQRGLRGLPRKELPDLWEMVRRIYLFLPLIILRSEEHTSELQSLMRISYAVFGWKKKRKTKN